MASKLITYSATITAAPGTSVYIPAELKKALEEGFEVKEFQQVSFEKSNLVVVTVHLHKAGPATVA